MSISLIMLGAGNSTRFDMPTKKQWLRIKNEPLWLHVSKKFQKLYKFDKIIVVGSSDEINYMKRFGDFTFCEGGESRQESLKKALLHVQSQRVLVSDIARVCIRKKLLKRILNAKDKADCIVPALDVVDTVYYEQKPAKRELFKRIQTPQLSLTKVLKQALQSKDEFTDDSSAIFANGGSVHFVKGDERAYKLTCKKDLKKLTCIKKPSSDMFIGSGFDVHKFGEKRPLLLGGVEVHKQMGVYAHSDGDILAHALIDAILGAIGAGDVGELFPDTDEQYKNADSMKMLEQVCKFAQKVGFEFVNCDISILAQQPKISPYKQEIAKKLAKYLHVKENFVNIKATTTEKLGFIGRSEGIGVDAKVILKYWDWTKK